MPREIDKKYKEPAWHDVFVKLEDDKTFKIGQCYEDQAATTIACKKCGSHEFNVGQGSYFTAIKCVKCDWQICIHEG